MISAIANVRQAARLFRTQLAVRGSAWVAVEYGATQILRLTSTLVLARYLLGPEAFGFVALVNVFVAGLEMLSDLGVGANVVQHPRGADPDFLDVSFTIQAARGLILWVATTALAYPLAVFYGQPTLFPLALVAAVGVAVRGFASPAVWTLNRQVQRGRLALLTMTSEAATFAVALAWAWMAPSAWALVAGTLTNATIFTLASYALPGHRVSFRWNSRTAREILQFGAWITLSTGTHFLAGQGERLILGKFVTPQELGCFSVALMLATAPSRGLEQLGGQVLFPLIAQSVRHGQFAVVGYYRKARLIFLGLSLLMVVAFAGLSQWLVAVLLPSKYEATGWMLQLLGVRAAFDVFGAPASALLLASGLSVYSAAGNMTRLGFLIVGLLVAFSSFGLREAVWVLALSPVAVYFPAMLVGMTKHFRVLVRAELLSLLVFFATVVLAGLAWKVTH
jgi:O-antigen/teichoic acid export membrane protein